MDNFDDCLGAWPDLWRYPRLWTAVLWEMEISPETRFGSVLDALTKQVPMTAEGVWNWLMAEGELLAAELLLTLPSFLEEATSPQMREWGTQEELLTARKAAYFGFQREASLLQERADRMDNPNLSDKLARNIEKYFKSATERSAISLLGLAEQGEWLKDEETRLREVLKSKSVALRGSSAEDAWDERFEETLEKGEWDQAQWMLDQWKSKRRNAGETLLFSPAPPWPLYRMKPEQVCRILLGTAVAPPGMGHHWLVNQNDQTAQDLIVALERLFIIKDQINFDQASDMYTKLYHFLRSTDGEIPASDPAIRIDEDKHFLIATFPGLLSSWLPHTALQWQSQGGGMTLCMPKQHGGTPPSLEGISPHWVLFDPWETIKTPPVGILVLKVVTLFRLVPEVGHRWSKLLVDLGRQIPTNVFLPKEPLCPCIGGLLQEKEILEHCFCLDCASMDEDKRRLGIASLVAVAGGKFEHSSVLDRMLFLAGCHPTVLWGFLRTIFELHRNNSKFTEFVITGKDVREAWSSQSFREEYIFPLTDPLRQKPLAREILLHLFMESTSSPCGFTSCFISVEELMAEMEEAKYEHAKIREAFGILVKIGLVIHEKSMDRWKIHASGVLDLVLMKI